jgi:outer membrane protein OmpA-like peptidoglycan-associated protein
MIKKLLILFLSGMLCNSLSAQQFLGLRASNFGGISNVSWNPAIAGSPFAADINLISAGFTFSNNYVGLDRRAIYDTDKFGESDFQDQYLKERINGRAKSLYLATKIQGPFSFMFSFGKNKSNKNAIAFSYNLNAVMNADGISEKLARLSYWGVGFKAEQKEPFNYQRLQNQNLSIQAMVWADYSLTYSREIFEIKQHYLKAGLTAKLVQGLMAAYLSSENVDYRWQDFDTLSLYNTDVSFGYSQSAITSQDYNNLESPSDYVKMITGFKPSKPTFAFDFGLVYEWRPDKDQYKYEMDGREWYRNDKDLYKIAAGISVTDLGRVNFDQAPQSYSFNVDKRDWFVKNMQFSDGLQSLTDTINEVAGFVSTDRPSKFKNNLPARLNFWVDYNIWKGFGLNFSGSVSPRMMKDPNKVHHISTFALTPRYDHAWFGAYLPFNIDQYANVNLGLTLRLGPVIIGTSDFLGLIAKKYVYNADIHFGLKVPIPHHKPGDRDKDKVSNRIDQCRKLPGSWESKGCPDKDKDGLTDNEDECPDIPGSVELKGCPDRDKDGITDASDLCPDEAGMPEMNGCPDKDRDGITDREDVCPDEAGTADLKGCPDKDGDKVADREDDCPEVPGDTEHRGCPDTDGDGVYDQTDRCKEEAGPASNQGCPVKVEPSPEQKKVVDMAMRGLQFETGKAVILSSSLPVLNELADILTEDQSLRLEVSGHTDNVGSSEDNLKLSKDRAEAVKAYLKTRGIAEARIFCEGFGDSRPVADNGTEEGRSINRRVEMQLK